MGAAFFTAEWEAWKKNWERNLLAGNPDTWDTRRQLPALGEASKQKLIDEAKLPTKKGRAILSHTIQYLEHSHLYRPEKKSCMLCNGSGMRHTRQQFTEICWTCKGSGFSNQGKKKQICTVCKGIGKQVVREGTPEPCYACKGQGYHFLHNVSDPADKAAASLLRSILDWRNPDMPLDIEYERRDAKREIGSIYKELFKHEETQRLLARTRPHHSTRKAKSRSSRRRRSSKAGR